MVVRSCNLRKVFGNLVEGALPQIAGKREHVGFVHQCQVLARARGGKFECVTHATLYAARSVHTSLRCNFVRCPLTQHAAFACVRTFCVFANYYKLVWRGVAWCSSRERALIDIQVQFKTHLQQQPAFDNTWRHIGGADCAQQNRIKLAKLIERCIRQHFAVAQIPRATQIKRGEIQLHAGSINNFQRLGNNFWPNSIATNYGNTMSLFRRRIHRYPS